MTITANDLKKVCIYEPHGVDCYKLKCDKCGWNPHNEELRKKRTEKVLWNKHIEEMILKAGANHDESDESESERKNR